MKEMDYDVPRPRGLYWVMMAEGEPPTVAENYVDEGRIHFFDESGEAKEKLVVLYKWWNELGWEGEARKPFQVLCGCQLPGAPLGEFR